MNATKGILIGLGILVFMGLFGAMGFYNSLVGMEESIISMDSQVKNMYERRTDLVPQVAAVVKKYAEYERGTFEGIVKLREASGNLATLQNMGKEGKVTSAEYSSLLTSTLSTLKITMEAYPQLKADTQFTNLFTTLEGSENRIRVEIKNYNDAIAVYNLQVRSFPYGKIFSGIFGFSAKERINPPEEKEIKVVPDVENLLDIGQ
ncbi:MAG: LemA family protein [uncultured bacterium (gcode 4)]|uniref:LemA family protein n=1 Tax=uncultured bacterium (gcode 4) TaxID=1234023 RepID=K1XYP0_9BACT|nr:MAG: LemA family protein [uncultured bacterium (gcode 4)]HBB27078.1 LemA family protein [Candidatus Gracilibacteria bacterium]